MTTRRKFLTLFFSTTAVAAAGIIPSAPAATGQVFVKDIDYAIVPDPRRFDGLSFGEALQKYIEELGQAHMFEHNDDFTRRNLRQSIGNFCTEYKSRREVEDYVVICDETNNIPAEIDQGMLRIDVYYKKTKGISYTHLNVVMQNTYANINGI